MEVGGGAPPMICRYDTYTENRTCKMFAVIVVTQQKNKSAQK